MQRWFFWLPDLLLSSKIFVYSAGLIQLTPTEQVVTKRKVKLVVISDSPLMKTSWNELNSWLAASASRGGEGEPLLPSPANKSPNVSHSYQLRSFPLPHCYCRTHWWPLMPQNKMPERDKKDWILIKNVSFHLRDMPTIPMAAASKGGEGGPCCSSYRESRVGHWTHFRVNPSQLAPSSLNLSSSASFILICDQPQGDR